MNDEPRSAQADQADAAKPPHSIADATTQDRDEQETVPPAPAGARPDAVEPIPERLGRCRIVKELGRGGMGAVYLADDTELHRQVALKIPNLPQEDNPEMLERFYREARAAATLNHTNICQVYDIGEHEGTRYITMAYMSGPSLTELVGTAKLRSERTIARFVRKIAFGLAEAHGKGILHRDLKPGNILLDARNEPVITDFGLARQVEQRAEERLTKEGMLLGTPAYMSPEQIGVEADRMGPASDVYSLGVILYELLTGKLPYQGPIAAVIGQIIDGKPKRPTELRADLDKRLEGICLKMMANSLEDRYSSAGEVVAALSHYLEQSARDTKATTMQAGDAQTKLEAHKQHTLGLMKEGKVNEAATRLQKLAKVQGPGAEPYVEWAKTELDRLNVTPSKARAPREGEPTHATARGRWVRVPPIPLAIGVAVICFLFVVLLGIVLRVKTPEGTLVVEVNEPDVTVQVLDDAGKVVIERQAQKGTLTIGVDPGNHRLRLEKDGLEVFAKDFTIASGGKQIIKARFEPASAPLPKEAVEPVSEIPGTGSLASDSSNWPVVFEDPLTDPASLTKLHCSLGQYTRAPNVEQNQGIGIWGTHTLSALWLKVPVADRYCFSLDCTFPREQRFCLWCSGPGHGNTNKVGYYLWLNELNGELWREGDVVSTFPVPQDLATGEVHHAEFSRQGARLSLAVDNRVLVDYQDPVPLTDPLYSRVGFGRQGGDASPLLCRNIKLRRPALSSQDQSALSTVALLPGATIPPAKNMDVLFEASAAGMMDESWLHSQPQHSVLCGGNKLVLLPDNASPAVIRKTPIKGDFAFEVTFEYVAPVFPQPADDPAKSRAENWLRAGDKEINLFLVVAYNKQCPPRERFANFYEDVPTGWEAGIPIGSGENVLCWTKGRKRECLAEMPHHAPVAGRKYTARLERHGDIVRLFLDGVYLLSAQQPVPLADPEMPAFVGVRQVFCGAVVHEAAAYRIVADENAKDGIVSTPDRKPAEWILDLGGTVNVNLAYGGWSKLSAVGEIPKGVFRIEWINLNDNQQVTDEAMKNLAGLSSVRQLFLARTPISDAGLRHIRGLISLRLLELVGTRITDAALQEINGLKNLKLLNLDQTEITDGGLAALQDLTQLEELHLWTCKNVGDEGMQYLKGMSRLRWLNMEGSQVGDDGIAHLSELKALQVLGLGGTRITDAGLEKISTLVNLKILNLSETEITDRGLASLQDITELEELGLRHCARVGDEGMQYLKGMSKLRSLGLNFTQVGDEGLACVAGLKALQVLGLDGTRITDAGLEKISSLNSLKTLTMSPADITDRGLAALQDMTQLEELGLYQCTRVGDEGIRNLKRMTKLRRLGLEQTQVGDNGIASLSELTKLQYLGLAGTQISDAAIAHLGALPKLDDFNLAQTSVTDRALEHLKDASSLRKLNVTGTQITKEGLRQFQLARPDCAIVGP